MLNNNEVIQNFFPYITPNMISKTIINKLQYHKDSGFVVYKDVKSHLIADFGKIGPTYLPGHAHADTLSFELAVNGDRVIVNSGTSEYGNSKERLRQRGTSAHSTVEIDNRISIVHIFIDGHCLISW
jgi:uncharacterized heparinase superfamily protein